MHRAQSMSSLTGKILFFLWGKIEMLLSHLLILLDPRFCSLHYLSFTSVPRLCKSTIYCELIFFPPNCQSHTAILHSVELSPDPWRSNKRKKGKKDLKSDRKDFRHMHPQRIRHFQLSSSQRGGRLEIAALPPMGTAVKLPFPDFLLSDRRKTGNAALPPMRAAVKLQLPDFLLSEWRKTGKWESAAVAGSGKAAWVHQEGRRTSPLPVNVKWNERIDSSVFSCSPYPVNSHLIWMEREESHKLTLASDTFWIEFLGLWTYILPQK